jgi:hypothetical protein|tara:strand:- start:433 stop:627 length:195 start_codon:yes stop_codon:yes gene_type:complete
MADVFRDTLSAIRDERKELAEEIADGRCSDFADYRNKCGIREGLGNAERILVEVLQKIEGDDDD